MLNTVHKMVCLTQSILDSGIMVKSKKTVGEIIQAVKGSGGIKASIANRLGVHRHTITRYIEKYTTVREAYDNEVELIGDLAEAVIQKSIQSGDIDTAKWYARMKLKDRGYSEKYDIAGEVEHRLKGYVNVSPDDWPDAEK